MMNIVVDVMGGINMCNICEENIYYCRNRKSWILKVENNHWNDYLDSQDYTELIINYCYNCGRKF